MRDTVGLPITVWGTFVENAHGEAPNLSGSTSSSRQRAHLGCGALAPYPHASRALDPFGPHITSVMTLVARDADSCCFFMTQVHESTPCGPRHSDARTSARSNPPPLVRWRCDRAAVGTHGEALRGLWGGFSPSLICCFGRTTMCMGPMCVYLQCHACEID